MPTEVLTAGEHRMVKSQHTALDKSAHALRQGRLLGIKQELSVMMKRCA